MGISLMNDKLQSLDMTLAKEMAEKQQHFSLCHNTMHVSFLLTVFFIYFYYYQPQTMLNII